MSALPLSSATRSKPPPPRATAMVWAFDGMIFVLVYCTAGISGGHINPAVTFGLLVARKVSLVRAVAYMHNAWDRVICGVALVKALMKHYYNTHGGGANSVAPLQIRCSGR